MKVLSAVSRESKQREREGEREQPLQRQHAGKVSECRACKVKSSYGADSTNNLHRHIKTVHPSVQLEEKRQANEPAANESVSLSAATVVAAAATVSTDSTVHHHNHLHLQPELCDTVCEKGYVL